MSQYDDDAVRLFEEECDTCGRLYFDCRCCKFCGGSGVAGGTVGGCDCSHCQGTGDEVQPARESRRRPPA